MSIVRQNGMNHWLRMLRLVHGSVVPVTRAAIGGLRTATIVSATKPSLRLDDLVFFRLGLADVAERAFMHEGEMRVVE